MRRRLERTLQNLLKHLLRHRHRLNNPFFCFYAQIAVLYAYMSCISKDQVFKKVVQDFFS